MKRNETWKGRAKIKNEIVKNPVFDRQYFGCGGIMKDIDTQTEHFVKHSFYEMLGVKYAKFKRFLL